MKDFITSTAALKQDIGRTYHRLISRGKIPESALVTSLVPGDYQAIADGQSRFFGEARPDTMKRLKNECDQINFDVEHSFKLSNPLDMIGYLLTLQETEKSRRFVYAVAIEPQFRRGWANVFLKYHVADRLLSAGFIELGFRADPTQIDARNHSKRTNAQHIDYH